MNCIADHESFSIVGPYMALRVGGTSTDWRAMYGCSINLWQLAGRYVRGKGSKLRVQPQVQISLSFPLDFDSCSRT